MTSKEFAAKIYEHDHCFKIYKSIGADLNSELKKLWFLTFNILLLVLPGKEERGKRLIILHVCNIVSHEFLLSLFIPRVEYKTRSPSEIYVLLKVCFD